VLTSVQMKVCKTGCAVHRYVRVASHGNFTSSVHETKETIASGHAKAVHQALHGGAVTLGQVSGWNTAGSSLGVFHYFL
jgi:hypothetical protein